MNKFTEIRPVVLGVAIKNNKLLVSEGYDKVKNTTFYRCLGGGIEFLETSVEALKREFMEEISVNVIVKDFLGVTENIFNYEGKNGHEIIIYYSIDIADKDYKDKYVLVEEGVEDTAIWVDIDEFKSGNKILYPSSFFDDIKW